MLLEVVQTYLIKEQARKFKVISLLLLSSVTLSACANTYVEGFDLDGSDSRVVIKNTSIFKQCKPIYSHYESEKSNYFFGVRCSFENRIPPDSFEIVYAVWPNDDISFERFFGEEVWRYESGESNIYTSTDGKRVSKEEWMTLGNENLNQVVEQLPESAWQTYTVEVKSTLEKYKDKTPEGRPMGIVIPLGLGMVYPSLFPSLKDRTLNLDIRIDKQGNIEVEEKYNWENELRQNPYA